VYKQQKQKCLGAEKSVKIEVDLLLLTKLVRNFMCNDLGMGTAPVARDFKIFEGT
jgi:hypothetical protein